MSHPTNPTTKNHHFPHETHSSSFQSDPWIRWSLHSKGMSSSRLFSGGVSSWVTACASISQSSGLPVLEAGARPTPPALPPTLGHVWVWLWQAGGKKDKRKSPHHTCSQLLSLYSRPIFFSNHCRDKNGMPSAPSMTEDKNCQSALHVNEHHTAGPVPCFCKL